MDKDTHDKLGRFLEGVSTSAEKKADFLANPIRAINENLETGSTMSAQQVSLGNKVLMSVLSQPQALQKILALNDEHKAGTLSHDDRVVQVAQTMLSSSPQELQEEIAQLRGTDEVTIDNLKHPITAGLANLYVAANETAVVNHFVVHNTEYVTSGAALIKRNELIKIANMLTQNK